IRGASALMKRPAISTSVMWGRTPTKRSTFFRPAPATRTLVGPPEKARTVQPSPTALPLVTNFPSIATQSLTIHVAKDNPLQEATSTEEKRSPDWLGATCLPIGALNTSGP